MSRPRVASIEAKLEIAILKTKIEKIEASNQELTKFKERIELGQKWLLCVVYVLGGLAGFIYTVIEIVKALNIRVG